VVADEAVWKRLPGGTRVRDGIRVRDKRGALAVSLFVTGLIAAPVAASPSCPSFVASSEGLPTTAEWRTHPAFGDANGDGRTDVAGMPRKGQGPQVFMGDGRGRWESQSRGLKIPGFSCGVGVDFADVDEDGHLDLGVADHCGGVFVFHGNSEGVWRMSSSPLIQRTRHGFDDVMFGDVNGDGHQDIALSGSFRGGVVILYGDGSGDFARRADGVIDSGFGPDVTLGDINRDGMLDIATTTTGIDHTPYREKRRLPTVWLSEPSGRYRLAANGIPDEGDFRGVALGDVNEDGYLDLAISAGRWPGRSPLLVYLGDGGERWRPSPAGAIETPETVYEAVELADLDRDGHLDLVAVDYREAGIDVWMGDGRGGFERCSESGLPAGREELRGWGLAVGDANGDGLLDLAAGFGKGTKGSLEVWVQE